LIGILGGCFLRNSNPFQLSLGAIREGNNYPIIPTGPSWLEKPGGTMKNKNTLFLSAALTAFVLVMLVSVVTVVRGLSDPGVAAAEADPTSSPAVAVQTEAPVQVVNLAATQPESTDAPLTVSPEEAANIAAKVLNRQDLFSVETIPSDGKNVYQVAFSNGDLVTVSLEGQVLGIILQPPANLTTVASTSGSGNGPSHNGSGSGSQPKSSSQGDHEEHDSHEGGGEGHDD
jgi:hypothetical protein